MKHIILCADDYGQTHAISQAIIDLLKHQRLSAVSCMVTSSFWPQHAKWLSSFSDQVDIGLHFNLTEGKSLVNPENNFLPLSFLLLRTHARLLNKAMVRDELHAQLDCFVQHAGKLPDFIDGHQHVHHLPVIRNVMLEVYEERLRGKGCYIRSIYNHKSLWSINSITYFKKVIMQLTGASALKRELGSRNIPHNSSFEGVYSFDGASNYAALFNGFLSRIREGGLVMCHPGLEDPSSMDVIRYARFNEYLFFNSNEFLTSLAQYKVKLVRFDELNK